MNSLFPDYEDRVDREWRDMPAFDMPGEEPFKQLIVSFATLEDYNKFRELIQQPITVKTKSIWFPPPKVDKVAQLRYTEEMKLGDIVSFKDGNKTYKAKFIQDCGDAVKVELEGQELLIQKKYLDEE